MQVARGILFIDGTAQHGWLVEKFIILFFNEISYFAYTVYHVNA